MTVIPCSFNLSEAPSSMAFQGANPLSNLPSSFTIILSFSHEFLVMNFLPVKRLTYPHGLEQPFQLRQFFCHLLHFPDTLGSDREKSVDQILGALQICKIQKLCSIGKSWKPLRKREAGEADTFVLNRIRIQQRLQLH